jgi:hypothetical protein
MDDGRACARCVWPPSTVAAVASAAFLTAGVLAVWMLKRKRPDNTPPADAPMIKAVDQHHGSIGTMASIRGMEAARAIVYESSKNHSQVRQEMTRSNQTNSQVMGAGTCYTSGIGGGTLMLGRADADAIYVQRICLALSSVVHPLAGRTAGAVLQPHWGGGLHHGRTAAP